MGKRNGAEKTERNRENGTACSSLFVWWEQVGKVGKKYPHHPRVMRIAA